MVDIIGYSALILNLFSMTMKNVLHLRMLAIGANSIYIIYGVFLKATPFIVGCTIAVVIHAYNVYNLYVGKRQSNSKSGQLLIQ